MVGVGSIPPWLYTSYARTTEALAASALLTQAYSLQSIDGTHCTVRASPVPKERKKTDNPREGWENGTPPPHRDFKERGVVR